MSVAAAIAAGAIAAGSGIANTAINYGINKDLQHDARVFNSAEAQKQRDWEQYMASTQYQRMMSDMEKAGINPASLSGVNAQSNSVPSGSSASSSSPWFQSNAFSGVSDIANSALKGVLAKDRNAARIFANEVLDNAKHGYRMEEMQEKLDLDKKLQEFRSSLASERNSARDAARLIELERKADLQDLELYKKRLGHKSYR